jgi:hypothetical protein
VSGLDPRLEPLAEVRRFEVINGALGRRRWTADDCGRDARAWGRRVRGGAPAWVDAAAGVQVAPGGPQADGGQCARPCVLRNRPRRRPCRRRASPKTWSTEARPHSESCWSRDRGGGGQDHEVRYEAKKEHVSTAEVKSAVKTVGNSRKKVEAELER